MLESQGSADVRRVVGWADRLAALPIDAASSDPDLLTLIEALERVKDACAAVQARATHEYSERRLTGVPAGSQQDRAARRDIAGRIARARHVSPFHGNRYLELARMLVRDLPATLDALAQGHTNEHRAGLVAHAATCLAPVHRRALDTDLGPRLAGLGDRAVQAAADQLAALLDPPSVLERHHRALQERRVTCRPAPDAMTYLTAVLPVVDGVSTWTALDRYATTAKAAGDPRSRGQLMADELTRRLTPVGDGAAGGQPLDGPESTGPATATATVPTSSDQAASPVTSTTARPATPRHIDLMLVMTDRTLLDGDTTPATIPGHGPIPADLARALLADADRDTRVFLRRLYTDPAGTQLLTADARGRLFPHAVRQFVLARDQRCRTPWCDAVIRHVDHREPYAAGGSTSLGNAQGLCARCNLAKGATEGVSGAPAPPPPLRGAGRHVPGRPPSRDEVEP